MTSIANDTVAHKDAPDTLENTRKRLKFRAWHRGTREMDILVGCFADAHVEGFDARDLKAFEELLTCNDPDVYDWYIGAKPVPAADDSAVLQKFLSFKLTEGGK